MNTAQIQEMIDLYVEAEKAILTGQSYSIGNRSLTRANLTEIRNARSEWEQRLVNLTIKTRGGNPNYAVSTFC
jgi:hypothetical protein